MSDFGILLSAKKKNETAFSSNEASALSSRLKSVIEDNDFQTMLGDPFQHEFVESAEDSELVVQLCEYYFGDEEPEETMEFVEENELDDAKEIATKMNTEFSDIAFKASMEEW